MAYLPRSRHIVIIAFAGGCGFSETDRSRQCLLHAVHLFELKACYEMAVPYF
jgi:hypothetical protein